jgi:hypothetical protein
VKRLLSAIDARDVAGLIGLSLVTVGCWQMYPPAAFLVPGAILLGLALWRVR